MKNVINQNFFKLKINGDKAKKILRNKLRKQVFNERDNINLGNRTAGFKNERLKTKFFKNSLSLKNKCI